MLLVVFFALGMKQVPNDVYFLHNLSLLLPYLRVTVRTAYWVVWKKYRIQFGPIQEFFRDLGISNYNTYL